MCVICLNWALLTLLTDKLVVDDSTGVGTVCAPQLVDMDIRILVLFSAFVVAASGNR